MKEQILTILRGILGDDMPIELSVPEAPAFGHYSTNVAMRMRTQGTRDKEPGIRKEPPMELAKGLVEQIIHKAPPEFFEKVEAAAPGFINFWLSKKTVREEFSHFALRTSHFEDKKKTVIVEYSSVNIAKPFHLGHFRNTIIGDALANILDFLGYQVVRWNYLGDWGTQFGKLIVAYRTWGKQEDVERDPIGELQKLYVRFHEEAEKDPALEEQARQEFQKLEQGDKENRKLWEWFRKESLAEFEKVYRSLGVNFDVWTGESFFEADMKPTVEELLKKGIAERSEGAVVVKLDKEGLPPALMEKGDGASLYLTRDIANLRYRLKKYKPAKILYVVGNEQSLHFEQLFAVAKRLGIEGAELKHVKYGLVLGETGKKLSTRRGEGVAVQEILDKAKTLARGVVDEKARPALLAGQSLVSDPVAEQSQKGGARELSGAEKEEVAEAVGVGALKYNDLKENRATDIVFDWERMLDFTGDSAPYLQYTYARLRSIVRKAGERRTENGEQRTDLLDSDIELALMRKILEFPDVVLRAGETYATSVLAVYLFKLAAAVNKFYETTPILKDQREERVKARLALIETAAKVLRAGLGLLGIKTLEKI